MTARTVITVDGLAGTGKTTLSRLLAQKLGFIHFSTGLLYRVVGYLALKHNIDAEDGGQLAQLLSQNQIRLESDGLSARVLVNGQDISPQLHSPRVSEATSKIARHAEVRNALIDVQRSAFGDLPLVAEGRDMGTVIFPEAKVKFFVQASEDVRVARRLAQLKQDAGGNERCDFKDLESQMRIEILERDQRDASRELAPTCAAQDAIIIDNSSETLTQVVENMYAAVSQAGVLKDQV